MGMEDKKEGMDRFVVILNIFTAVLPNVPSVLFVLHAEGMAYPFQITTGRVILRIVMSSEHGGIIHNQNTRGCKSPMPSIFGNLFNLLSVVLCLYCFIQSGKTHILFTLFLLVIHNSDLRRNISCTKIEKQRYRRGPLCSSGKWLEK